MEVSRRFLKRDISAHIQDLSLEEFLLHIEKYPDQALIHSIMTCLCSVDNNVHWHATSAFGVVMARLAEQDMEKARVVMRRCMWMLNDESGGIGWGIPEAFAEALYQHSGLAEEYTHILISFMREEGFYLELEPLQRGLLWGIGRLAEKRPKLLLKKNAALYLLPYLDSKDATVKGLATRACGLLGLCEAKSKLQGMLTDATKVHVYKEDRLETVQLNELAEQALQLISS